MTIIHKHEINQKFITSYLFIRIAHAVSHIIKNKKGKKQKGTETKAQKETKRQEEQPLQLAGFGSSRNAC